MLPDGTGIAVSSRLHDPQSLVCYKIDITQNFIVLSYIHHPKAQILLCR